VALHDCEELHDDLGGGTDHDLALAGLLGVVDGIERVVQDLKEALACEFHCAWRWTYGSLDHVGGCSGRFSMAVGD
jgi:hypothetical protein